MLKQCTKCQHYNSKSWHCVVVIGKEINPNYRKVDKITGRVSTSGTDGLKYFRLHHPDWLKAYRKALKSSEGNSDSAQINIQKILNKSNQCKLFKSKIFIF